MARGGYVKPEVALSRIAKVTDSNDVARDRLVDALVSGHLMARGKPILGWGDEDAEDSPPSPFLKDMWEDLEEDVERLGEMEDIPPSYWSGLPLSSVEGWNWHEGYFSNSEKHKDGQWGFACVTLKVTDVNRLASHLRPSAAPPSAPTERLRQGFWGDWVAALATLAHEHSISGEMRQTELLNLIEARLEHRWGLKAPSASTVAPTANAVLERFRKNPPASPIS